MFINQLRTLCAPSFVIFFPILTGLRKCNGDTSVEDDAEAISTIDVRGRYANEVKEVLMGELMKNLSGCSGVKYLNVIVGCKVHGIGKGKLKDVVIQMLEDDLNIKYALRRDFIISMEFDVGIIPRVEKIISKKKIPLLSYPSSSKSMSPAFTYYGGGGGESGMLASGQEREMVLELERSPNDSLCSILSDLMFDLPKLPPYQNWDAKLIVKVLAALRKCHQDHCEDDIDGIYTTDLRGRSADEAKEALVSNLNCWAGLPSINHLNVLVGCKEHGVGEGKLKNMVSDLLNTDNSIMWTFASEVVISIQLEQEKDYSFLLD